MKRAMAASTITVPLDCTVGAAPAEATGSTTCPIQDIIFAIEESACPVAELNFGSASQDGGFKEGVPRSAEVPIRDGQDPAAGSPPMHPRVNQT